MTAKKTAPAKAPQAPKAPAVSKGEANGFRVGDVGVKVGGVVYAAGSVIPKELVTDEVSPFLVWEANVEDAPGEGEDVVVATTIPTSTETPKTDGSEGTNLGAESNGSAPQGGEAQTGGNQ